MFTAFKLPGLKFPENFTSDAPIFQNHCALVVEMLNSLLSKDEINGSEVQDLCFPEIKANIFISHSHGDSEMAVALQNWLMSKFGLTAFIDSTVWLYADDLLKMLDNKLCQDPGGKSYSYEKRNKTTSHVHLMLATALSKMIDACECVFFLNTPQSISIKDEVGETTYSQWIYYELSVLETIRKRSCKAHRPHLRTFFSKIAKTALNESIFYKVNIKKLPHLDVDFLNQWRSTCLSNAARGVSALDKLYSLAETTTITSIRE